MNPLGEAAARRAAELATGPEIQYSVLDCQAFVERCVADCGGKMDYRGSNDMARNMAWLGTLDNARAGGRLVPGALLFIHEDGESGLPARYQGDGLGDFSHVGLYVGPDYAFEDVDKSGRRRRCEVAHSSASMGRVAGSTLKNGWTHAGLAREMDYGVAAASGVEAAPVGGAGAASGGDGLVAGDAFGDNGLAAGDASEDNGLAAGENDSGDAGFAAGENDSGNDSLTAGTASPSRCATVTSPDGNPVKLRKTASTKEALYWKVAHGARVRVERVRGDWSLITAICTDGRVRRAYMLSAFLRG